MLLEYCVMQIITICVYDNIRHACKCIYLKAITSMSEFESMVLVVYFKKKEPQENIHCKCLFHPMFTHSVICLKFAIYYIASIEHIHSMFSKIFLFYIFHFISYLFFFVATYKAFEPTPSETVMTGY